MSDRVCIRGCTQQGVHYATCIDYGNPSGVCRGCAPVEARDGVLLCNRCYGRLRRKVEAAPELLAHLRGMADPLKAVDHTRIRVQSSSSELPAPVPSDVLDASRDIMHVLGGGSYAVELVLRSFDVLANDADAVLEWWRLVMSPQLAESPEFWTISGALSRWPLEDRQRWAKQPCPECGLQSVRVTPPRHRLARTWFACTACGWRKTEVDDDGLWAAAFGQYADAGHDEGSSMAKISKPRDIDLGEAIKAAVQYTTDNAAVVEKIGSFGVQSASVIGATAAIGEQFALLADGLAEHVHANYANGDLIAGGARLVATAIREAVAAGDGKAALTALATPPKPAIAVEGDAA